MGRVAALLLAAACAPDETSVRTDDDGGSTSSGSSGTSGPVPMDSSGGVSLGTTGGEATGPLDDTSDSGSPAMDVPPPVAPSTHFTDVTVEAKLDMDPGDFNTAPNCQLDFPAGPQEGDYCVPERFLGGVAVGDYDGDGWPDLYLTRLARPGVLMRNRGNGTFDDVTVQAGLTAPVRTGGVAWLDVEGDGDLDLMLSSFGSERHHLWINDGAGHFVDEALERGAAVLGRAVHVGTSIGVGDYDLDGYLDMFIGDWRTSIILGPSPNHNRLLHNLGEAAPGHFEDVTDAMGIDLQAVAAEAGAIPGAYGFAPAFVDLDGDGWPELALAGDYGTSRLWWNEGGTLVDGTVAAGVGTDHHGMGSTFGDYDGDGDLDWFVSAIETFDGLGGNRLYRNDGARTFVDVSEALGVRAGGWGWGAAFFDADLDADLDLALAAGWPNTAFGEDPVRVWRNDAGGEDAWPDVAIELGIDFTQGGRGLVPLDYDRDGDLDLLVVANTDPPALYRNDTVGTAWLQVDVAGPPGNPRGIGAVVRVRSEPDGPWQVRQIGVGSHLFGHGEAVAHFGLGPGTEPVAVVEVTWPGGAAPVVRYDVGRDQRLLVAAPR
jgi:hypothetical protein